MKVLQYIILVRIVVMSNPMKQSLIIIVAFLMKLPIHFLLRVPGLLIFMAYPRLTKSR